MNATERTTLLRALFHNEPSSETWSQIMDVFEDWDYRDSLQVGIDYASGHLEHWPEELRTAPPHWIQVLLGAPKYQVKRTWERGNRAHPAMQLVRHLDLTRRHHGLKTVGAKQIKHLTRAKDLRFVTSITLDNTRLGDDGAYILSDIKHLTSLKHLSLENCDLGPQGIWDLTEGKGQLLNRLESLNIQSNRFGDEGARGLAKPLAQANLRALSIGSCNMSTHGVTLMTQSPQLHKINNLTLAGSSYRMSAAMLQQWLEAPFVPNLQRLVLAYLRDQTITTMLKTSLPKLEHLDLQGTHCYETQIQPLISWLVSLPLLQTLEAKYVDEVTAQALEEATTQIKTHRPHFTAHITHNNH